MVLYGVEECRPGVSRSARQESDLSSVVTVFSALDSSIQPQSIRDCYRLGTFSPGASHPRPILVKFVRTADITKIFAKMKSLSIPFSIKPTHVKGNLLDLVFTSISVVLNDLIVHPYLF